MTDDEQLERYARALITAVSGGKVDPDMLVQLGHPNVYGTACGDVFAVKPGSEEPMWRMYLPVARTVRDLNMKFSLEELAVKA